MLRVLHRLDQLVDDVLGRRHVGVAHAEVDDVCACGARPRLDAVHLLEDIGRQASDAVEIAIRHGCPKTWRYRRFSQMRVARTDTGDHAGSERGASMYRPAAPESRFFGRAGTLKIRKRRIVQERWGKHH